MDYVTNIGVPDVLLTHNGEEEWLLQPITSPGRGWAREHALYQLPYQEGHFVIRGFRYVVELFDSMTDDGLTVR